MEPHHFKSFLESLPGNLVIPRLQRGYAHGRSENKHVLNRLLDNLFNALIDGETYKLGYIYVSPAAKQHGRVYELKDPSGTVCCRISLAGAADAEGASELMDGQQRLTTLYLLHWYILSVEKQTLQDADYLRRFVYMTRPTAMDFLGHLSCEPWTPQEQAEPTTPSQALKDRPWFSYPYLLDPSVAGMLTVLDSIHAHYKEAVPDGTRLAGRLRNLLFYTDTTMADPEETYIKMNSRDLPLTDFEHFKADLLDNLGGSVPDGFDSDLDNSWLLYFERSALASMRKQQISRADLEVLDAKCSQRFYRFFYRFCAHRHLINLARAASGEPDFFNAHTTEERRYTSFAPFKGIADSKEAACSIARVLGELCELEDDSIFRTSWGEMTAFFEDAYNQPTAVIFSAFCDYVMIHGCRAGLNRWMRVVYNIVQNTDINHWTVEAGLMAELQQLVPPPSVGVYEFMAGKTSNRHAVKEEILKAKLIQADPAWELELEDAESNTYFRGQIGFLLEFAGITGETEPTGQNMADFRKYAKTAKDIFLADAEGKRTGNPHNCFERAVLTKGDYLMHKGSGIFSLLSTESYRDDYTWKRFLREGSQKYRELVRTVFNDLEGETDIPSALAGMCENYKGGTDVWRNLLISCPELTAFCNKGFAAWVNGIRLLTGKRTNSSHAGLYTAHLWYSRLKQRGFDYVLVSKASETPGIKRSAPNGQGWVFIHEVFAGDSLEKFVVTRYNADGQPILQREYPVQEADPFLQKQEDSILGDLGDFLSYGEKSDNIIHPEGTIALDSHEIATGSAAIASTLQY